MTRPGLRGAGYYYVQRDAMWQAPCFNGRYRSRIGAWGDNLAGDPRA